jgi:hypothetical protein
MRLQVLQVTEVLFSVLFYPVPQYYLYIIGDISLTEIMMMLLKGYCGENRSINYPDEWGNLPAPALNINYNFDYTIRIITPERESLSNFR